MKIDYKAPDLVSVRLNVPVPVMSSAQIDADLIDDLIYKDVDDWS